MDNQVVLESTFNPLKNEIYYLYIAIEKYQCVLEWVTWKVDFTVGIKI